MASGSKSLHPVQREILESIGIPEETGGKPTVTQGVHLPSDNKVAASAGFHDKAGSINGKPYSDCFDLRWAALDKTKRDRLVAAGVCVFPRAWGHNAHHHCVSEGLTDSKGACRILPGPRQQIVDFGFQRTGLVGHKAWEGKWRPTDLECLAIRMAYQEWVPDYATWVYADGKSLRCYAWLEGPKPHRQVTCEAWALVEGLGGRILEASSKWQWLRVRLPGGEPKEINLGLSAYLSGEFLRAPVRPIAEAMGYSVAFSWAADRASCRVDLTGGP